MKTSSTSSFLRASTREQQQQQQQQGHRKTATLLTFDLSSGTVNSTQIDLEENNNEDHQQPQEAEAAAVLEEEVTPGVTPAPTEAHQEDNSYWVSIASHAPNEVNSYWIPVASEAPSSTPTTTTATTTATTPPQDILAEASQETATDEDQQAANAQPHEQSEEEEGTGVLKSLRLYDDLRARAPQDFLRDESGTHVNVDRLSTPEGDIAFCHLSSIIPFTFGDNAPWLTAFEDAAAIALAIQHLNAGDGTIVPEVEGLNERCNVRFTTEFADTEFTGGVTLGHVVDQTSRDPGTVERIPCAFVGAYRSAVSLPMSIVTGLLGYPQVSGASTSADLDDTSQYPLFGRTIPTDAGNAVPIIRYIREVLQVQHLAVINVNDAYGNAYVQGMRKAAELHAPDMVIHQIPLDDDPASVPAAIDSLHTTEYRYVYAVVFTPETHDALLEEAFNREAAGTGKHTWLFGDSFLGTLDGRTFLKDGPLHKAYQGAGLFEVTGGVDGMPKYDDFINAVAELRNPTDLSYLGSLFPVNDHPDYAVHGTPPYVTTEDYLSHITSGFAPFSYEAVIALGLAACNASETHLNFTGQEHFDAFRNTTFSGFSGKVMFDPTTGTRDPRSALYKVTNYLATDEVDPETGEDVVRFKPVITDLFLEGNWTQQTDYIFNDGTNMLPPDLPPSSSGDNDDDLRIGLFVGIAAAIVAVLGVVIFLFYENKRKKNDSVWQVNKEDLEFADPPKIIGRGTFGLILLAEYRGTQVAVKRVIPPKADKKPGRGAESTKDASGISAETGSGVSGHSSGLSTGTHSSGGDSSHNDEPKVENGLSSGLGLSSHSNNAGSKRGIGSRSGIFGDPQSWSMSGVGSLLTGGRGRASMAAGRNDAATWKRLKQEFIAEMRYLSKLRHPCITTVMGAVTVGEPMLIMEYMDHGSLYDLLHNETMVLEGELLLPILKDITQGVRFLHSSEPQVIHGDLKAANVLVDSRFRGKVADFGLSQKKNLGGTGTPYWMAPELLRLESTNTTASDVYSMGIILYEVYSRRDPYQGEDAREVLRLIADKAVCKRPPIPKHMPDQLKGMMTDCLEEDADKRPSFEELDVRLRRIDAKSVDAGLVVNKTISLFDIFPRHIAEALRDGRTVEPEHKESVTIFFSDIVGFTNISSTLDPRKVASMLDRLYTKLDNLSHNVHDIFKVETIGDAYMCVTNLVKDQTNDHAKRIAAFAIDAIKAANSTLIDEDDPEKGYVNIRVGFHSGPVVADVVGTRNPRYCLFGDTVNTSSRMESNSEANRIHCSNAAAKILHKQWPELPLASRGVIKIKGKGEMKTWWVNEEGQTRRKTKTMASSEFLEVKAKMETLQELASEDFCSKEFCKEADEDAPKETALV